MAVTSVNGQTGAVTITPANIGAAAKDLSNVVAGVDTGTFAGASVDASSAKVRRTSIVVDASGVDAIGMVTSASGGNTQLGDQAFINTLAISTTAGGQGATGGANSVEVTLHHNGASNVGPTGADQGNGQNGNMVGLAVGCFGENGVDNTYGGIFALNPFAGVVGGYKVGAVAAFEADTYLDNGCTAFAHTVGSFAHYSPQRPTSALDSDINISAFPNAKGRLAAIQLNDGNGYTPIESDGVILQAISAHGSYVYTAESAFDFSGYNFSGNFLTHKNLTINNSGLITASTAGGVTNNTGFQAQTAGTAGQTDAQLIFFGGVAGSPLEGTAAVQAGVLLAPTTTPLADNAYNLGGGATRWANVFAANGVIVTSDAEQKSVEAEITSDEYALLLDAVVATPIKIFQYNDAIAKKGKDKARLHVGIVAQDLQAAFKARGLDPDRHGVFCADPDYDEVEESYTVQVPMMETYTEEVASVRVESGRAIKTVTHVKRTRPVAPDLIPMVDGSDVPVMNKAVPAKYRTQVKAGTDNEMESVQVVPAIPAHQVMYQVPRMTMETRSRTVQKLNGKLRLGIRYDQLHALMIAAMSRRAA